MYVGIKIIIWPRLLCRNELIKMKTYFILSYVVKEKESHLICPSSEQIKFIIAPLEKTLAAGGWKVFFGTTFYGPHEIFTLLGNLAARSDKTIKYIVDVNVLHLVVKVFSDPTYNDMEKKECLKTVTCAARLAWQISLCSDPQMKEALLNNPILMEG